jgi:hypothetical protein
MKENSLKSNHVQDSHRLLVIATLIIFVLANIISLYLYLSGKDRPNLASADRPGNAGHIFNACRNSGNHQILPQP